VAKVSRKQMADLIAQQQQETQGDIAANGLTGRNARRAEDAVDLTLAEIAEEEGHTALAQQLRRKIGDLDSRAALFPRQGRPGQDLRGTNNRAGRAPRAGAPAQDPRPWPARAGIPRSQATSCGKAPGHPPPISLGHGPPPEPSTSPEGHPIRPSGNAGSTQADESA
jgi:hypothetical protein